MSEEFFSKRILKKAYWAVSITEKIGFWNKLPRRFLTDGVPRRRNPPSQVDAEGKVAGKADMAVASDKDEELTDMAVASDEDKGRELARGLEMTEARVRSGNGRTAEASATTFWEPGLWFTVKLKRRRMRNQRDSINGAVNAYRLVLCGLWSVYTVK